MGWLLDKVPSAPEHVRDAATAYDVVHDAKKTLGEVIARSFPTGSAVQWLHGRNLQTGTVVSHMQDGVVAANDKTQNRVRVSLFSIIQSYEKGSH